MKRFLAAILGVALALELLFRVFWQPLFDASHRALFKIAVLQKQPEVNVVALGSSRTQLGFIPAQFDTQMRGAAKSFDLSVTGTTFELETYMLERLRGKNVKLLFFELGAPSFGHAPLDWGERHALALLDLRSVLRHDSLARLATIAVAARRLDGSEVSGGDYWQTLRHGHRSTCDACENAYPVPAPSAAVNGPLSAEMTRYRDVLAQLKQQGTMVVLVVSPLMREHTGFERTTEFRAGTSALAAALDAPLYDLSDAFDEKDMKDHHHLSPKGAEKYTDLMARIALLYMKPS